MKKIFMLILIIISITACDPAEKVTIKNDTEYVYKFLFLDTHMSQDEITVNPQGEYLFMLIGLYSEKDRKNLEDQLINVKIIEQNSTGSQKIFKNEEAAKMINKGLIFLNGEWVILCSKFK